MALFFVNLQIKESRKMERDSTTGVQKVSVSHQIGVLPVLCCVACDFFLSFRRQVPYLPEEG